MCGTPFAQRGKRMSKGALSRNARFPRSERWRKKRRKGRGAEALRSFPEG